MKYNQVTWYSKLAAVILFLIVVPVLSFYIGVRYQEVKGSYWEEGYKDDSSKQPTSKLPAGQSKAITVAWVSPTQTVSGSILTVHGRGFRDVSRLNFYQNGQLLGAISNPTVVASDGVELKFIFSQDFYVQSLKTKPGVYQIAVANGAEVSNKVNLTVK